MVESGGLESRATDFGSDIAHIWSGGLESGNLVSEGLESGGLDKIFLAVSITPKSPGKSLESLSVEDVWGSRV